MANLNLSLEKIEAIRSEYRHRNVRVKYPRQKIKPDYKTIYPWILPDEIDPYYVFCTLCECRLSAKRSDLGKHEGSIKHRENANKKLTVDNSVILKDGYQQTGMGSETDPTLDSVLNWECADEDDNKTLIRANNKEIQIMKLEPVVDLIENSNDLNMDNDSCGDNDESRDSDNDVTFMANSKRSSSDFDSTSQHSNTLDYLPLQVNISEAPTPRPQFTLTAVSSIATSKSNSTPGTSYYNSINYPCAPITSTVTSTKTPCKITIKKITAPLPPATLPTQIKSTATITPVLSTKSTSSQNNISPQSHTAYPINASSTSTWRDSYDLFF